ncbi:hypothetical protein QR680_016994 [Steinernema hermaphroditum]|uniref:RCK N-terminal domain-containing protein n=1 Tax=Steinernema hermaphroditum TaxID=289476 RepID=A0AA39HDX4_9BILA|nr:hypothetical protein QR680_016994 [Steinernema hermaphroditum]
MRRFLVKLGILERRHDANPEVERHLARMQYGNDQSFKSRLQQYFFDNYYSSLSIRVFNLFIKVLSCVLYCVRVSQDSRLLPEHVVQSYKSRNYTGDDFQWEYFWWVDRSFYLWLTQAVVAAISIAETFVIFYISYKGSVLRFLLTKEFLVECITSGFLLVTVFVPQWRELFVPFFLNSLLARSALQGMLNDFNRTAIFGQSAMVRQIISLFSSLACLIFIGTCSIEHLQRAGDRKFDLFMSFYFCLVTLSTVGYGDLYPDTHPARLLVIAMILAAFLFLPSQIEALGQTLAEKRRAGEDYAKSGNEIHVVVTITHLNAAFIDDFLNEFYAHPEHQGYIVVLLSPSEMDNKTRLLLKIPKWSSRVHYVRGTALKDEDLERAKMHDAKACFILSARHVKDKNSIDEQTILRSWAVKDFAPNVPQYVQVFRPETKMHIEHAEILICEDEFKYSLLANNCICPGISTFITLLMHTSRGEEGQKSTEPWHKVYGFHSGNEIYDILVGESKFFSEFIGKSFTYASFHAHRSYGVALVGVRREGTSEQIKLNPGQTHIMQASDVAYYMALTNEESLTNFRKGVKDQRRKANLAATIANIGTVALDLPHVASEDNKALKKKRKRRLLRGKEVIDSDEMHLIDVPSEDRNRRSSIAMVADSAQQDSSEDSDEEPTCAQCQGRCVAEDAIAFEASFWLESGIRIEKTYPPVTSYIGTSPTVCHMMREKRPICCLQVAEPCRHCNYLTASQYNWKNPAVIVAVDKTSSGLYNLIIPLRAYYRPIHELQPIILLLELDQNKSPNPAFLDVIAWFPMVYWMQGRISSLDNLLKAGVCRAEHVVVVKEGTTAPGQDEFLADCSTIITVQKIHRMFPDLRLVTELTHSSNMRFMQFDASDPYTLQQSKFEKKERKRNSNLAFMFRIPFAQGGVFSANMLDRLLYQAFVKHYLVQFIRLLLGIDQSTGSGYLTSFKIHEEDMWIRTYGRLYQKLCSSVADIPIGIYRTNEMNAKTISMDMERMKKKECQKNETVGPNSKRREISQMVQIRMRNLGLSPDDYRAETDKKDTISFVIINPSFDLELEPGDVIYVLRPPVAEDAKGKRINPRRGLRRHRMSPETRLLDNYNHDRPHRPDIPEVVISP